MSVTLVVAVCRSMEAAGKRGRRLQTSCRYSVLATRTQLRPAALASYIASSARFSTADEVSGLPEKIVRPMLGVFVRV